MGGAMPERIRVLLIENRNLADGLLHILRRNYSAKIDVLGSFDNAEEGIEKALELKPNVIINSMGLPGMDGVAATKILKEKLPNTKIIMFTSHTEMDLLQAAMEAGISAFVPKYYRSHTEVGSKIIPTSPQDLVEIIQYVSVEDKMRIYPYQ